MGVLKTGINKIDENDKDSSTGKYSNRNYFPMGFFLEGLMFDRYAEVCPGRSVVLTL